MKTEQDKLTPDEVKDFRNRLTRAFGKLRKGGYFAQQKFWCCQSCAWSAIPEENEGKVVFYHEQDAEWIPFGDVWMAWDGDYEFIMKTFRDEGLFPTWNGAQGTRILVSFDDPQK